MQLTQLERLPPSDLCDALVQITRSKGRRRQAIELRGEDAISFADAAQKVCILPRPIFLTLHVRIQAIANP